jgi:hypothetical protein
VDTPAIGRIGLSDDGLDAGLLGTPRARSACLITRQSP